MQKLKIQAVVLGYHRTYCTKYKRHRVTQARKIIGALNGIWWLKDITKKLEKDDL